MNEPFSASPSLQALHRLQRRLGSVTLVGLMSLAAAAWALAFAAWLGWLLAADWSWDVWLASAVASAATAAGLGAGWMHLFNHSVQAAAQQAATAAADPSTGTLARRVFLQLADREWARCRRYGHDGALLLVDVDHFRGVLGQHGTECVEALMRQTAKAIALSLRGSDGLGRNMDEQFAVFLPNTDPLGALDVAERIREQVARQVLRWNEAGVATTVSVGVASVGVAHTALDALVHDAQNALDAARAAGRNCVRAAPVQPRAQPTLSPAAPPPLPKGNERGR